MSQQKQPRRHVLYRVHFSRAPTDGDVDDMPLLAFTTLVEVAAAEEEEGEAAAAAAAAEAVEAAAAAAARRRGR